MPLVLGLGKFRVAPFRCQLCLDEVGEKVREGAPRFRPENLHPDAHDAVAVGVIFEGDDGTAKALREAALMLARFLAGKHHLHLGKRFG